MTVWPAGYKSARRLTFESCGSPAALTSAQVPDLLIACAQAAGNVRVDLTEILSADVIATDALRRVRSTGAELVGAPRYLLFTLDSR